MIKKIIHIKNIGKFNECNPSDDTKFAKATIVYAENKRGKSTFSDILRSLKTGSNKILEGRESFKSTGNISVNIRVNDENYKFKNMRWDHEPLSNLEIYDEKFVNKHVISGYEISSDHKKRLNAIISDNELKNKISELKTSIENKQKDELKDLLEFSINDQKGNTYKLGDFEDQLDDDFKNRFEQTDLEQLQEKSRKLNLKLQQVSQTEKIDTKEKLKPLSNTHEILKKLVSSDVDNLKELEIKVINKLNQELNLNPTTLKKVKQYFNSLGMTEKSEGWLKKGCEHIEDNKCPFCTRDLEPVKDRIDALTEYFDADDYNKKLKALRSMRATLDEIRKQDIVKSNATDFERNKNNLAFWEKVADLGELSFPQEIKDVDYLNIVVSVRKIVQDKIDDPIGEINDSQNEEIKNLFIQLNTYDQSISEYNELVEKTNKKITSIKKKVSKLTSQDLNKLVNNRNLLEFCILLKTQKKVDTLTQFLTLKDKIEELKNEMKKKQELLADRIREDHRKYGEQTNIELKDLIGDVEITNMNSAYKGRGTEPFTEFGIKVCGEEIELNFEEGVPSLSSALSTSDRSSLGLAFFLAKLRVDNNLSDKIIVLDDPVSSYDIHNEHTICLKIAKLANESKQTIILTHDLSFALKLAKRIRHQTNVQTLKLKRGEGNHTDIVQSDFDDTLVDDYFKDYDDIHSYVKGKDQVDSTNVARKVRPVLERYLKIKFPKTLGKKQTLGEMISFLNNDSLDDYLKEYKKDNLSNLEEINDYISELGHGKLSPQQINDTELHNKVKRVLELIHS